MHSFRRELYESFRRTNAGLLALLAIILGLIPIIFDVSEEFKLKWLVIPVLLLLVAFYILSDLLIRAFGEIRRLEAELAQSARLPSVIFPYHPFTVSGAQGTLLLLSPSDVFSVGGLAGIHFVGPE